MQTVTSLLRNNLDKEMLMFKKLNPDFYAGYVAARVIVDRGGRTAMPPAPAPPPQPAMQNKGGGAAPPAFPRMMMEVLAEGRQIHFHLQPERQNTFRLFYF